MDYDLEEERVIAAIRDGKHRKVLLQLPDGLKPAVEQLVPRLEQATGATILTWLGTNFGACDLPIQVQSLGVTLCVAFGHNRYVKEAKGW